MPDRECLVPIPWETRNLGVESFSLAESFVKKPESLLLGQSIADKVNECGRLFVQVRVDKADSGVAPILADHRFYPVESAMAVYTVFSRNICLKEFRENNGSVLVRRFNAEHFSFFRIGNNETAKRGAVKTMAEQSFSYDRFHLDPNSSSAIASKRLGYLMGDLLSDDTVVFYLLEYDGEAVGFISRREDELIIAGLSKKYENSGLGSFLWLSSMKDMEDTGLTGARTLISTNNILSLNLHTRIGFKFRKTFITYHFWAG